MPGSRSSSSSASSSAASASALDAALLRELANTWAELSHNHFRGALRPPALELVDTSTRLGAWHRATRTISLSRTLVYGQPWGTVREVFKHELAHQYVDEAMGIHDETAHGPAFAEVCRILVSNIDAVGGALGLYITFTGNPRQFQFQDQRVYYYLALGFMLLATGVAALIERRRFGMYLSAIREDETACEALGVNTFKYKMLAMLVSSFLTGLGGTFYAFYLFSLQPATVFGIPLSVEIVIRPVIGGSGTLIGPILGSFILTPLAEASRYYFGQSGLHGAHLIVYGTLLMAVVLFLPQGAYPFLRRLFAGRSHPAP